MSKARWCFYPRERITVERANSIELARCKMSYQAYSHKRAKLAKETALSPRLKPGACAPQEKVKWEQIVFTSA